MWNESWDLYPVLADNWSITQHVKPRVAPKSLDTFRTHRDKRRNDATLERSFNLTMTYERLIHESYNESV